MAKKKLVAPELEPAAVSIPVEEIVSVTPPAPPKPAPEPEPAPVAPPPPVEVQLGSLAVNDRFFYKGQEYLVKQKLQYGTNYCCNITAADTATLGNSTMVKPK